MPQTQDKLVHAAIETFARDGFRRATMGDIAAAAGVSRPTLYARFASKDEVIAAAIETLGNEMLAVLLVRWQSAHTLHDVLRNICDEITLKQYDMIRSMPESEELFATLSGIGADALAQVDRTLTEALAEKLAGVVACPADQVAPVAGFFVAASKGLKKGAPSRAALESHLDTLINATSALVAERR